ncbi:dTDP-4-dehydrorhamnose 3,5-epimerase family protein [Rhodococcus ruber]|uniref:dTDP-4-dehydrorhamnose 3,5-epimerase family protein n=1 Tax=Rhodococcus ruber TaxID=1830 RepID=A0ABT4MAP1_9NOCA|nr:dTDP-4-dehydrorhamnose 3,5-epimerase family protein [Rhodococcus ruber]MCZ4518036.1 dTDP-4-dehydrorhamnose 3,5-epimerase family protein [Rhodococcus ruber]
MGAKVINAKQDEQTVDDDGNLILTLPHLVKMRSCGSIVDERGSLCEMFNPDWEWSAKPLTYSYFFTIRPRMVKGWGVHYSHEDRLFLLSGEVQLVMFDCREDSPTAQKVFEVFLHERNRMIINIPEGVYHAIRNIGLVDAVIVNFPTELYTPDNPDQFKASLDAKDIPYSFSSIY